MLNNHHNAKYEIKYSHFYANNTSVNMSKVTFLQILEVKMEYSISFDLRFLDLFSIFKTSENNNNSRNSKNNKYLLFFKLGNLIFYCKNSIPCFFSQLLQNKINNQVYNYFDSNSLSKLAYNIIFDILDKDNENNRNNKDKNKKMRKVIFIIKIIKTITIIIHNL